MAALFIPLVFAGDDGIVGCNYFLLCPHDLLLDFCNQALSYHYTNTPVFLSSTRTYTNTSSFELFINIISFVV